MSCRLILVPILFAATTLSPGDSWGMGRKPQRAPLRAAPRHVRNIPSRPRADPITPPSPKIPEPPKQTYPRGVVGEVYRRRYVVATASTKLVDNHGNGDRRLYGTRNMRPVLNGVLYRGGGNNYYSNIHRRANMNPLPEDGLNNLCEEGFGHAVYLYPTHYRSAQRLTRCRAFTGSENTLEYLQLTPLDSGQSLAQIHDLIFEHIRNPRLGPIYTHCWNGWHASGYVAATALRQFCGFTADQAVQYWNVNTDGHAGSSYNGVRARIRAFQPRRDLDLSPSEKAALCPVPQSYSYLR